MTEKLQNVFNELMDMVDACNDRKEFDTAREIITIAGHLLDVRLEYFKEKTGLDIES